MLLVFYHDLVFPIFLPLYFCQKKLQPMSFGLVFLWVFTPTTLARAARRTAEVSMGEDSMVCLIYNAPYFREGCPRKFKQTGPGPGMDQVTHLSNCHNYISFRGFSPKVKKRNSPDNWLKKPGPLVISRWRLGSGPIQ